MEWKLILWLISVFVFWGYALWYIFNYNIPESWSDTFYTLNKIRKSKGYIFTLILWGLVFTLLPITLEKHPIMFPVLTSIAFVGAAPAFKSSILEKKVHIIGAIISVLSMTLVIGLFYNLWYVMLILISLLALLQFKWKPVNKTMWIESITILIGQLVILFKDVL